MYGALWRLLPGPNWLRIIILFLLAAAVLVVCFNWVFPWISDYMPFNDQTVEAIGTGQAGQPEQALLFNY